MVLRLLLVSCCVLAALQAQALPRPSAEWYLLESRGLQVLTDGNPDRAELLVGELLDFQVALESSLPPGPDADGRPLLLFLFRDGASMARYKPVVDGRVSEAAGFFLPRREGAFIVMELSSRASLRIVRHELVHFAMNRRYGGAPPWLEEGMAEYLAAGRRDRRGFLLGEEIPQHLQRLNRSGLLPAEKLVRVQAFEAAHSNSSHAHRLYAESWGIVHWLRTGGAAARALHDRLLEQLRVRGRETPDLIELGGFEPGALDARVRAHLALEPLPTERIALPRAERPALTRRRVDPEIALGALGDLCFALGRPREAREHHEAALRKRDSLARAWRGLGLLEEAAGRSEEARPLLERAAELAPNEPEVLLSLGRNLLGVTAPDFDADRVPPQDAARGRELLRRAVSLAPNRAESLAALGLAGLLVETGADSETGAALEVAHEVLPHRSDIAYHFMLWRLRRGDLEEALVLLDEVVLPREPEDSELAIRATNVATAACLERARLLRHRGESGEAIALLTSRLERGVHELLRPEVTRLLRELRQSP